MSEKSVTLVCLSAYPLFSKVSSNRMGGMETRAALFAKGVASAGSWKTVLAVGDFGQDKIESRQGVDLVIYRPILKAIQDNVVPRFKKYRWRIVVHLDVRDFHFLWHFPLYLLFQLLPKCLFNRFWRRLAPDVVCCFGNNATSTEVIADCYRAGIKTVFCVASDEDLAADYTPSNRELTRFGTPKWMAWYAVATADCVMVQTEHQRDLLRRNFGREGALVRNPVPVPDLAGGSWTPTSQRKYVLWVGRSDTFNKRPLLVLDLARLIPEVSFVMVVNRNDAAVSDRLLSERPGNVKILEYVPHERIWDYFRNARMFINTSVFEGFPNTFLQAAVSGAAVVSLCVDPESLFSKNGCGLCSGGDFNKFAEEVRRLWADHEATSSLAAKFYRYVAVNHRLENQTEEFAALLERVVAAPGRHPPSCWARPFSRFVPSSERVLG